MEVFHEKTVKKSRAAYCCSWCNETIDIGQPYKGWGWRHFTDHGHEKMHPECAEAMDSIIGELDGWFSPGEFTRGCTCQRGETRCDHKWKPEQCEVV